jgi:hypothetical protein
VRISRTILLGGLAFAALVAGVVPMGLSGGPSRFGFGSPEAQAQNLGQRVVTGKVVDANDAPVMDATVFLKNLKTKAIRSYSADENGKYRFTQVNMSEDHELWAEKNGKKSAVKTVSAWDTRKLFDCELKLK